MIEVQSDASARPATCDWVNMAKAIGMLAKTILRGESAQGESDYSEWGGFPSPGENAHEMRHAFNLPLRPNKKARVQ